MSKETISNIMTDGVPLPILLQIAQQERQGWQNGIAQVRIQHRVNRTIGNDAEAKACEERLAKIFAAIDEMDVIIAEIETAMKSQNAGANKDTTAPATPDLEPVMGENGHSAR